MKVKSAKTIIVFFSGFQGFVHVIITTLSFHIEIFLRILPLAER